MESRDKKICRELLEVRNFWSERNELEMRAADKNSEDEKLRIARLMHAAMVNDYRRILESDESATIRLGHSRAVMGQKSVRRTRVKKSDEELMKDKSEEGI